jgi:hypothetical protein
VNGTPWQLGARCDHPGCTVIFEADFLVPEDSTRDDRLRTLLEHVGSIGWDVEYPPDSDPVEAKTFCPRCVKLTGDTPGSAATAADLREGNA